MRWKYLYSESQDELEKVKRQLIAVAQERENYRMFISEHRCIREYMMWWARKEGFSEVDIVQLGDRVKDAA